LRFAFYGRVSTEDYQDPVTSRARQRGQAAALVAGYGRIMAEYFDIGQSRELPWARRPEAAALLAAMADADRAFNAIVVGEYERAFHGAQFSLMAPLFAHYGVQLWTPEAGGRVDFAAEGDEQLMIVLGIQSKREITRTRIRVRTAMAAQTRDQGRYLGGRPPYGYRLADAGPHPNRAHAAWGRRAHRLEPDPGTAPTVSWIFAQRLSGHSLARIARALNDMEIPCPSAADPQRNAHRSGQAWMVTTVRAIVSNPRYTGRQVWNRQPTDHELLDPSNTGLGHRQVQRWSLPEGWVISARPAHPALVSEADFIAVQGLRAAHDATDPERIELIQLVPRNFEHGLQQLRARFATINDLAFQLHSESSIDERNAVADALHRGFLLLRELARPVTFTKCVEHPDGAIDPDPPVGWGKCLLCNIRRQRAQRPTLPSIPRQFPLGTPKPRSSRSNLDFTHRSGPSADQRPSAALSPQGHNVPSGREGLPFSNQQQ
jgi:DNA invertase Pin-like site-specific DNA recombinase